MADGTWRHRCTLCGGLVCWRGQLSDQPPCPTCYPNQRQPRIADIDALEAAQDALDQCDRILDVFDRLRRADATAMRNRRRKVEGIPVWVEKFLQISETQQSALDSIEDELGRSMF